MNDLYCSGKQNIFLFKQGLVLLINRNKNGTLALFLSRYNRGANIKAWSLKPAKPVRAVRFRFFQSRTATSSLLLFF